MCCAWSLWYGFGIQWVIMKIVVKVPWGYWFDPTSHSQRASCQNRSATHAIQPQKPHLQSIDSWHSGEFWSCISDWNLSFWHLPLQLESAWRSSRWSSHSQWRPVQLDLDHIPEHFPSDGFQTSIPAGWFVPCSWTFANNYLHSETRITADLCPVCCNTINYMTHHQISVNTIYHIDTPSKSKFEEFNMIMTTNCPARVPWTAFSHSSPPRQAASRSSATSTWSQAR